MVRELDRGACFIDEFLLPTLLATDALQAPGGFTHECLDRGHAAISVTRYLHIVLHMLIMQIVTKYKSIYCKQNKIAKRKD